MDPAVDVHDVAAHAVGHAVDWVPDELSRGHLEKNIYFSFSASKSPPTLAVNKLTPIYIIVTM